MANVRLGFVGTGGMGQCAHLVNYANLPGCEVAALAELRPKLGRKVAARYGVPGVYTDYRKMLEEETLDGLVAIQPFTKHAQLIPELLASGLPVLTEKPLARSVEAGETVLQAAREGGGPLYIGYHKRSDPATLAVKRQLDAWKASGEVGALKYLRVTMPPGDWVSGGFNALLHTDEPYPALPDDPPSPDFSEEAAGQYDGFVNYYIHQVNLIRFLLGEAYHVVYADPTGALLVGRAESGVPVTLEMAPYSTTLDWQESALVAFERGWAQLTLPAPLSVNRAGTATFFTDPGSGATPQTISPSLPTVHAMRQQALHYVQAVRGEPTVLCGPDDALADLMVAKEYISLLRQEA